MIKKKISFEKHAPQTRLFIEYNVPQARLIKQNAPQDRFFDQVLIGTLSCKCSMYSFSHQSQFRFFFF